MTGDRHEYVCVAVREQQQELVEVVELVEHLKVNHLVLESPVHSDMLYWQLNQTVVRPLTSGLDQSRKKNSVYRVLEAKKRVGSK